MGKSPRSETTKVYFLLSCSFPAVGLDTPLLLSPPRTPLQIFAVPPAGDRNVQVAQGH